MKASPVDLYKLARCLRENPGLKNGRQLHTHGMVRYHVQDVGYHRIDGPSVIWVNENTPCRYYLHGFRLSYRQWLDVLCETDVERTLMILRTSHLNR
jgi:hypothetical protein